MARYQVRFRVRPPMGGRARTAYTWDGDVAPADLWRWVAQQLSATHPDTLAQLVAVEVRPVEVVREATGETTGAETNR